MAQEDLEELLEKDFRARPETAEAIKELFRDGIDKDTDKRIIDQKADLNEAQIRALSKIDFFHTKGVFSSLDGFSHSFKRHTVSKGRKGRIEAVDMAKGVQEQRQGAGFMRRFFGGGGQV